jgi:hypothetical protein
MCAFGWHRNVVYDFNPKRPKHNVNKIHGSMLLKGQWPWPKAETEEEEDIKSRNTEGHTMEAGIMFTSADDEEEERVDKAHEVNLEQRVEWFLAT